MKILMCPPDYYDIEYEINPWMHIENKVDKSIVENQYNLLKKLYMEIGMEVLEIEPIKGLPDMVYSANFGHVENNTFIPANFKYDERKKESQYAIEYFEARSYKIERLPNDIYFEGQGDFLKRGKKYFMGWGKRTDRRAKNYLEKLLNAPIVDLKLVDPYYYHLDTCFAPLQEQLVLINPTSFTTEGMSTIYREFKTVIEATPQDHQVLACNLIVHNGHVVVNKGISTTLKDTLRTHGFTLHETPMSEYLKGGGSVKCVSLEMY